MSNDISRKIEDEMLDYEVAVVKYAETQQLPRPIIEQLTSAVTAIGAHYAEAQDASSKKDFINKIYIAKKEAHGTKHWLKFVARYRGESNEIQDFIDQTQHFLMALQIILSSTHNQSAQGKG